MGKVIIFSHESDIDGLGNIVLGKLAFNDIDYELSPNVEPQELKFREYLDNKKIYDYDMVYITDLALYNPSLDRVANDDILKNKVKVFDHHEKAILQGCAKYDFTKIEEKDDNGKKRCATELFYEYLKENDLIKATDALDTFVEFTRLEDTWDWKTDKIPEAHDLAILFNKVGIEKYIEMMVKKLSSNHLFTYSEEELRLIKEKKEEYEKTLKKYISETEFFEDENGNEFGIVYAPYQYRNELPEYFRDNKVKDIKYFITVALDKDKYGQKSYRTVEEGFDVNEVAMKHNGGGHPGASSVSITKKQREKASTLSRREGLKFIADSSFEI